MKYEKEPTGIRKKQNVATPSDKTILFSHKDVGDIDRGGVGVLFKSLAGGLVNTGWNVHVATSQQLNMEGVTTHILPFVEDPLAYSRQVSEIVDAVTPNIAEASTWRYELLDYSRRQSRRSNVIVRADPSAGTLFSGAKHLDPGEQELCRRADLIVAVSGFAQTDIQRKYGVSEVHVVYNGIPKKETSLEKDRIHSGELLLPAVDERKSLDQTKVTDIVKPGMVNVFWIGKPTKMKGFHLLEDIVSNAPNNFNFVINTGYAPSEVKWDEKNYEKCTFIRALTKEDQLLLLKNSSVFLSTSTIEGFGIVVAEALQMGLPAILNSACEVYHEFLPNDGITLIDMGTPNIAIEAIKEQGNKKVDYSRLPERFTQEFMVRKSIEHYDTLLEGK